MTVHYERLDGQKSAMARITLGHTMYLAARAAARAATGQGSEKGQLGEPERAAGPAKHGGHDEIVELGAAGQLFIQIGTNRAMSAFASATVTPRLSLATPWNPNPGRISRLRSKRVGRMTSAAAVTMRNHCGITPTIVRGTASMTMLRPTAAGSAPNRRCQYPWLSTAA